MVSGPINCVKYLVFVFNLIFFVLGIALVAVGSYVQTQVSDFLTLSDTNISGPAVLLIVVGLIIFIIAFFGCCGAIKENYCMVLTFSILMMIILICQIGGAIAGFVYSHKITDETSTELFKSMADFDESGEPEEQNGVTKSWNLLQSEFTCCGVRLPTDWKMLKAYEERPPSSCCNTTATLECKEYDDPNSNANIYQKGCLGELQDLFEKNVYYIGAVGISLAVIQVMGIVLSCCLARAVHKEYDVE